MARRAVSPRDPKPTHTAAQVERALRTLASPRDAEFLQGFFKTGKGQYGEGDRFLGVRVPQLRAVARRFRGLSHAQVLSLLRSRWHEARLVALLLLVDQHRRGTEAERNRIYRDYLRHTRYINNWDLVDTSAKHIVGPRVGPEHLDTLADLARSDSVWERRIAVLATFLWIGRDEFRPALLVASLLVNDRHDLIHKAVGWMLRELGKRNIAVEEAFLREHYRNMPRTMLRYAIERLPKTRRQHYLNGSF
jgi:3-methyladenine DNA glycosylase AlkD